MTGYSSRASRACAPIVVVVQAPVMRIMCYEDPSARNRCIHTTSTNAVGETFMNASNATSAAD